MTLEEAAQMVATSQGWTPLCGFEYDGSFYVTATPLQDYLYGADVAQAIFPVTEDGVGEPFTLGEFGWKALDDSGFYEASLATVKF